ncbi:unnamed protein product, partial [Rotaria socialis]
VHPLFRLKKPPLSRSQWHSKPENTWLSNLLPSPSPSSSSSSSNRSPPPSVVMVILDAVSDLQARRALPQTLSYLRS